MDELKAVYENLKERVESLNRVVRMQQEMINVLHATAVARNDRKSVVEHYRAAIEFVDDRENAKGE